MLYKSDAVNARYVNMYTHHIQRTEFECASSRYWDSEENYN
uniref:Uncharacterized protein n=1 Tax=Anguilla anguilla TaxID=7936 RepID=A0A0E9PCL8_ANGAN